MISSESLNTKGWKLGEASTERIMEKMQSVGMSLGQVTDGKILYGIKTGLVEAFIIDETTKDALIRQSPKAAAVIKPYIIGDEVRKYHIRNGKRFLIYTPRGISLEGCESILDYLMQYKERLEHRATKQEWYELQQSQERYSFYYEQPKIIYPDIAKESRFAFDASGSYPADTTFIIPTDDLYLLGVLNSRVAFFYLKMICPILGDPNRGGRLRLKLNYIQQLPIRTIDPTNPTDKQQHDAIVAHVDRMLTLHKQLAQTLNPHDKTFLQSQIAATDAAIDRLVYTLYGLTEEEISVVEGD